MIGRQSITQLDSECLSNRSHTNGQDCTADRDVTFNMVISKRIRTGLGHTHTTQTRYRHCNPIVPFTDDVTEREARWLVGRLVANSRRQQLMDRMCHEERSSDN